MTRERRQVVIVGGGIAGLCAAVHASRCGYDTIVLEQHTAPGGLATSWRRGEYTFETCLHWLLGSRPGGALNARWREVCDIDRLSFVDATEYVRMVGARGEQLPLYTNVARMEAQLLIHSPKDAAAIHHFASNVHQLAGMRMSDDFWPPSWGMILRNLPNLLLLRRLSSISLEAYGRRFRDPLIRAFFGAGDVASMPVLATLFSLAWMSKRNAGYPLGGSQALIRLIVEQLLQSGGQLRLGAKVTGIEIQSDTAVGVALAGGETVRADWVISAADGHATLYEWLGGNYIDADTDRAYNTLIPFPSYLQVSFGVAQELSEQATFLTRLLGERLRVDPQTELDRVSFRIFNHDPTFAPTGKTAITAFLPTRNCRFWVDLKRHAPAGYEIEKRRVADAVAAVLEMCLPEIRQRIEVTDVSTPATVIDATCNWQGSMEGWLMPLGGLKPLHMTLPRLRHFMMIGQWVFPGGGLPSGLISARAAIRAMCRHDGVPFASRAVGQGLHRAA